MIEVDVAVRLGAFSLETAFTNAAGITALFGRSGSGKSTVINLIAGLTRPDRGHIVLDGRAIFDSVSGVFVPRHRRRVGLVFQDSLLFPHLSVRQNLMFGRFFSPREGRRIDVEHVIDTLGVGHLLDRRPAQLSGGEKQRVAIGRALLAKPGVLLMDEPLASLDVPRRLEILTLIERLRDEFGIPIVYVSHAIEEVARLASMVVVLENGRVEAIGTPGAVFGIVGETVDAAERFRIASVLDATVGAYDSSYGLTPLLHPAGTVYLTGPLDPPGRRVRVVVRGTDVALATERPRHLSIRTVLRGTISKIVRDEHPLAAVTLSLEGEGRLTALATRKAIDELGLHAGGAVFALVKTVALDERPIAAAAGDGGPGLQSGSKRSR